MPSEEAGHVSPMEVTPRLGKAALDTWWFPYPCGGRLDKTGVTPRRVRRRGCGQITASGVHANQRLNFAEGEKTYGRKPRFQTGPGKSGRPAL
jgi:hypothetical protein